ncbi:MAG: hypothetical protein WC399_00980 [Bacilli bacterium]|jgi:hypothetical protein
MKKYLAIIPLLALALVGCNSSSEGSSFDPGDLLSIEVVSGLEEEYEQNAVVDLDEITVTATFENDEETIEGSELTFAPETLDTSTVGEFELTITYLTESVVWTYTVVEYFEIDNISAPDFVTTYFENITEKSEGNKRSEFMDREQGYAVGDDNAFKFFPNIYAYNSDDEEIEVTSYHSVSTVQMENETEWVTLTGSALDEMVAIDEFASTYDFTEAAVGHTFRLSVRPYGDQYAVEAKFMTSFEFNVVDGHNVYEQDDLAIFNNVGTHWDAYRTEKGLTTSNINGLVFQNDIEIVRENLPDSFFYMAGDADVLPTDSDVDRVYGSLRDNVDLYHRDILPEEEFTINGNYFSLDYSTLPVVVRESGRVDAEPGLVISHSTLIKAGAVQTGEDLGDYTLKNLLIVGNANRTEDPEKSGGAIFMKMVSVDAWVYNAIATQCFTIYLSEISAPTVILEKCRGYDSFSSMLYNWGSPDFLIKDSEFIGAGGPIIISDHVNPGPDGTEGNIPHTRVENSVLESLVHGGENWFRLVSATAAIGPIKDLGDDLRLFGTNSITKTYDIGGEPVTQFNMVGLIKDGAASAPSSTKINGTFQIDDGVALDFSGQFMTAVASFDKAAPRLQDTNGVMGIYTGYSGMEVINPLTQLPAPYYATSNANYFTGDYLNLYYNMGGDGYMGLVFGMLDSAA